MTIAIIMR